MTTTVINTINRYSCDYHSGGLPSSRRPLAAVDNRLHTGNEFQNFRGIALYDNFARLYATKMY